MTDEKKTQSSAEEYIDQSLRRVYSQLESEDIPDRFKDLLSKLREQDQRDPSSG